MILRNIKRIGWTLNVDTKQVVCIKQGRNTKRSTEHIYYLHKGKRVFLTDREYYGGKWIACYNWEN